MRKAIMIKIPSFCSTSVRSPLSRSIFVAPVAAQQQAGRVSRVPAAGDAAAYTRDAQHEESAGHSSEKALSRRSDRRGDSRVARRGGAGPLSSDAMMPRNFDRIGQVMRDFQREMDDMARIFGFPSPRDLNLPSLLDDVSVPALTPLASFAVDVQEQPDKFLFKVDAPGLDKSDIKVQVNKDNVLTISGERQEEREEDDKGYARIERTMGKFIRRFQLPDNVDPSHIKAKMENGVLQLEIPKREPEPEHTTDVQVE